MRVRKVDSDAIKLYESSQVKFKTTGIMREVQFSAGVNKSCAIQNISKDTHLDKVTGEINKRKHNVDFINSALSRQGLNTAPAKLKETWIQGGYKYEVGIHPAEA